MTNQNPDSYANRSHSAIAAFYGSRYFHAERWSNIEKFSYMGDYRTINAYIDYIETAELDLND